MEAPARRPEDGAPSARIACSERLELSALRGLPIVQEGDDLTMLILAGLTREGISLRDGDVVVVTSKIVSRSEGRFVDLGRIEPSKRAADLARVTGKDPRLVELVLRDTAHVSRVAPGVLIVRHRLGFVCANAGIDCSNSQPSGATATSGPWALVLPEAPDASAARIRASLEGASGATVGVILSDSFGRPFRLGTVGVAIGVAGLPPLWDRRGEEDIFGRRLEQTITALADQVAAAADLVAGQAAEGRAVVHVRGLTFSAACATSAALLRSENEDLYAGSRGP